MSNREKMRAKPKRKPRRVVLGEQHYMRSCNCPDCQLLRDKGIPNGSKVRLVAEVLE